MSHQRHHVLTSLTVLVTLGALVLVQPAFYAADAAGGGRGGGGGHGGMRAGGMAGGGRVIGPRGHGAAVGSAGRWHNSSGHRHQGGFSSSKRLHGSHRAHKFHHRSTVFVNFAGPFYPPYYYYPYYPSYDSYYSPYYGYPSYPAYSAPYGVGFPGQAYPVEYQQPAGAYGYGAADTVQVYTAPSEPTPLPLAQPTAPASVRSSPGEPPGEGALNFQISPPEARIFLDGEYVGEAGEVAKIDEHPVVAGRHLLDIRVGAERTFMDVVVSPGRTTPVRLTLGSPGVSPAALNPEHGVLRIQVSPAGAAIYVDGAFAGIAAEADAVPFRLPPGRHDVQIVLPGHKGYDAKVTVPERGVAVLAVQLVPE